jgi:hypothetical protein
MNRVAPLNPNSPDNFEYIHTKKPGFFSNMKSISNERKVVIIFVIIVVGLVVAFSVGFSGPTSTIRAPSKPELGDYIDANGIVVATISKNENIDKSLTVTILNKSPNVNTTFIIGSDGSSESWSKTFLGDKVIKYKFTKKNIEMSETDINTSDSFVHFASRKIYS